MGTFRTTIEAARDADGPFESVEALVDSGASYTLLPAQLLERLGVVAIERQTFALADGRRVAQPIGEAAIRIDGHVRTNVVVFAEGTSQALLSALTLESLGLGIDPPGRRLIRVEGLLMTSDLPA